MPIMAKPIKTYDFAGLQQLMEQLHQPKFRAKQLYQWLYNKNASSYDEMTNLPTALREQLAEQFPLYFPTLIDKQVSIDSTRKYVLALSDGTLVETVGMPTEGNNEHNVRERLTVCFSTQVGCAMECAFCATGKEGFTRNLLPGEMVDQIIAVQNDFDQRVSNVVAMGQGEPFLNYENTLTALRIINSADALNIGARRITVSTCGIIDGINRFAQEPEQFTLAVSLHSAVQQKRDKLMPRVKNQPLDELHDALYSYIEKTNRRVTFEYLLIDGVNDSADDLKALEIFCRTLLCHINLLPMNSVANSPFQPSHSKTINTWVEYLNNAHIETTVRNSRGSDIAGACGQLKNSLK